MDKDKGRNPMSQWKLDTWQVRGQVLLTKSSNLVWEGRKKERERANERERESVGFLEREALPSL